MTRLKPHDDRPARRKKEELTTEVTKHDRLQWLVKVCIAELRKGSSWRDTKDFAEKTMISRWALGATARRDYQKMLAIEVEKQAGIDLMQKQYQ